MGNRPLFPDGNSSDLSSMGLTSFDAHDLCFAVVRSVDTEEGTVSAQFLNAFGCGFVEEVPILMPAVGADWGIAALPNPGDIVEIDWTPDGVAYARPTLPFRYWDWIDQAGIKPLQPGELFFKSSGGGKGLLSELGSVWWKDSVGSQVLLDPVFDLALLNGKGTGKLAGGGSSATVGGVIRNVFTSEGLQLQLVDLPLLPGLLPPNEYKLQIVPAQPSTFVGIPLTLVDLRRGDVYDDSGSRVTSSSNPLLNAMEQRKDSTLGFTNRLEQYFTDGSYVKEFGTAIPMVFGQKWDALSSNTWYVKPAGLTELEVLKLVANIVDPLVLAALTTGSVRKLVDQRILDAFNGHYHGIDSTAAGLIATYAAGTGAVTGGPLIAPGSSSLFVVPPIPGIPALSSPLKLVTGDSTALLPVAIPAVDFSMQVTTVATQAQ